jgi:AAA15 family ATPase/GTPase
MIEYIKLTNHKALKQAQMSDLGNINIICGKNNSGKTTILEALFDSKCHSIGKKVDDADWLTELFKPQVKRYTRPVPETSLARFRKHIERLIQDNVIWYSDENNKIIKEFYESKNNDANLGVSPGTYEFEPLLTEFFDKSNKYFAPFLIPPKRQMEFQSGINLNQDVLSSGVGIINKLFFLKNQDLESDDYKIYKRIYDTFFEITGSRFNVVPDKKNQISLVYLSNQKWIPALDSGLGLSDILIIVSLLNIIDSYVFLIEEPENHLHAEFQKKLLNYLSSLKAYQFFITTHSPVFLDSNIADKIFYCTNNGEIILSDQTSKSEMISSLGYSVTENLVADLIILLEGPTDIPVIQEMLNWLNVNTIFNIKYWPLGGDIMAFLDLSVFKESKNVFALVDSDPGSKKQRTRFMRNCKSNGIYCKILEKYSLENYFPLQSIRNSFPTQIPKNLKEILPTKSVDSQIGFKDVGKSIKAKNAQIVKSMSISDIEGTDLHKFLLDIKKFLQPNDS